MKEDLEAIAEYMGGELLAESSVYMPHGSQSELILQTWKIPQGVPLEDEDSAARGHFKYDVSYNWSMPVVEKIEEGYEVSIIDNECEISTTGYRSEGIVFERAGTKKAAIYGAIVKFLKWRSQNR